MKIVIIGNGISGITAARYIRKLSDHDITVISSESDFFFSRTALMYVYMGHMRWKDIQPYEDWFWLKNRIELQNDFIDHINFQDQSLRGRSGNVYQYDHLILALGSSTNKFGWPGQDLKGVSGLYSKQDLETMESFSPSLNRAVIVGGGLIGIEMAEMFRSRDIPVTMLVRESQYWNNVLPMEEATIIGDHIVEHHVDLRLESNLQEIIDDGQGNVAGVIIKETGETLDCGFVGLTPGVSPNISLVKNSELDTDKGVLVNEFLQTNIHNVWAIGDCAQLISPPGGRRAIEAVWYTGRMMGETVAYNICDTQRPYDPGIWFNSAKFMDIEYQVYGHVPNSDDADHDSFIWVHPDNRKSLRIVFDKTTRSVKGFNLLGIRYRHEVCEKWILQGTTIEEVVKNLRLANFDPEFYTDYSTLIRTQFNRQYERSIQLAENMGLNQVFKFLTRTK